MEVALSAVSPAEKDLLSHLLCDFQAEALHKKSTDEYKYLDSYWHDSGRLPLFIHCDGKLAGFALVNNYTMLEKGAKSIAEFYITKEFRLSGVGKTAAIKIFKMFPGKWEIRGMAYNTTAQRFWKNVISFYMHGKYTEVVLANEKWHGPVQIFDNSLIRAA